MTTKTPDSTHGAQLRSRLPQKITGIVFWCTVLIGLIIAMLQLEQREQQIHQQNQEIVNTIAADIALFLANKSAISSNQLITHSEKLMDEYAIQGLTIKTSALSLSVGEIDNDASLIPSETLRQHLLQTPVGHIEISISPHTGAPQIIQQRKQLLITMGLLFSAFGFFLQWLLTRVLTRPFQKMVNTAAQFTNGNIDVRFETKGNDEFSFLGRFFNEALDYLVAQQTELRTTLQRLVDAEIELFREKERAEVTLHSIGDAVITTDRHGRIDYLNPIAEKLTGHSLESVKGSSITATLVMIDEETRAAVDNPVTRCLLEGKTCELTEHTLLIDKAGEEIAIADSAAPIRDRENQIIGAVMVFHDVGHARKLAKELSYQASHDRLTDLYNRAAFEEKLKLALDSAHQDDRQHVFFYLDLDQFKIVNDTCGHIAGDELLRVIASLLQSRLRDSDILARLGGDEFGILLHDCILDDAKIVAAKLCDGIHDFRFIYQTHSFEIGVSVGVVTISRETEDITNILANADMACYAAKDAGRNRIHIYQPEDQELQAKRGEMRWLSRIQLSLEEDRYMLLCQPIQPVDDPSLTPHYEILLRMLDQDDRQIPPMAFIPAAERYNIMPLLDRWVFDKLIAEIEAHPEAQRNIIWNINLSGNSLGDSELLGHIINKLESIPVPASMFCFEITETTAIAKLTTATAFIDKLRTAGCSFALDDFGSGLSSFGYLKDLDVQYLKIDGSFIRDIATDPVDKAMVEAIHNVGKIMNLKTIAEFVENDLILEEIKHIGINYAQGFGIAKPQPLETIFADFRLH